MDMTRWFADNASAAGAACGVTLSPGEDAEVEATGETVGWFDYTLEVPEGEDRICFDLDVVQYASDGTSAGAGCVCGLRRTSGTSSRRCSG